MDKKRVEILFKHAYSNTNISFRAYEVISGYNISDDILREYYYEVVLPMKYDNNVMKVINKKFSLYLPDIESGKGR